MFVGGRKGEKCLIIQTCFRVEKGCLLIHMFVGGGGEKGERGV